METVRTQKDVEILFDILAIKDNIIQIDKYDEIRSFVIKTFNDGMRNGIKKERQRLMDNLDIFSDEFPDSTVKDFLIANDFITNDLNK